MNYQINTDIHIKAEASKVWEILTDFDNYPNWNPFIKTLKGTVAVGNTIEAVIAPPDGQAMIFKPKVLVFEKNKEFTWLGHLLFKGLFDGEHSFKLIDNQDGTTTFVQAEKFKGILVPLFKGMLNTKTRKGFQLMNQKLKERAEHQVV